MCVQEGGSGSQHDPCLDHEEEATKLCMNRRGEAGRMGRHCRRKVGHRNEGGRCRRKVAPGGSIVGR